MLLHSELKALNQSVDIVAVRSGPLGGSDGVVVGQVVAAVLVDSVAALLV